MTAVTVAVLFVLMAGGFFYLKIRVDRVVSGEEWIRKIRDEIDQLVLEMNQTAERNVALLEDRVRALRSLLEEADKKLLVLQKESEKSDLSRQVYTHLKKNALVSGNKSKDDHGLELFDESPQPEARTEEKADAKKPDLRKQVMELYGQGFSAQIISQKLGASISEVDLIINLSTGSGGLE